jgi:hypothetical protein
MLESSGRSIAKHWVLGMVEGLGHRIEAGRCLQCDDSYDRILERVAGCTAEQLVFGELKCAGAPDG